MNSISTINPIDIIIVFSVIVIYCIESLIMAIFTLRRKTIFIKGYVMAIYTGTGFVIFASSMFITLSSHLLHLNWILFYILYLFIIALIFHTLVVPYLFPNTIFLVNVVEDDLHKSLKEIFIKRDIDYAINQPNINIPDLNFEIKIGKNQRLLTREIRFKLKDDRNWCKIIIEDLKQIYINKSFDRFPWYGLMNLIVCSLLPILTIFLWIIPLFTTVWGY